MEAGQEPPIKIVPIEIENVSHASAFCDFCPSWQNSMDSIKRAGSDLVCLGALISDHIVGYCVFDAMTGDLSQIAVNREYRRKRIASRLLKEASEKITSDTVKVLNVCSTNHSLPAFLIKQNIEMTGKQFEMILSL